MRILRTDNNPCGPGCWPTRDGKCDCALSVLRGAGGNGLLEPLLLFALGAGAAIWAWKGFRH